PGCSVHMRLTGLLSAGPGLGDPGSEHEVLSKRVAVELRGQQKWCEVRVTREVDSEHLVRLPLVPRGAGVQVHNGCHCGGVAGHTGTDENAMTGHSGPHVCDHDVPLFLLIDRGEPVEEVAPK